MVQRRGGESYSRDRVAGDRIVGSQVTGYNRVTSDRMIGSQVTMVPSIETWKWRLRLGFCMGINLVHKGINMVESALLDCQRINEASSLHQPMVP